MKRMQRVILGVLVGFGLLVLGLVGFTVYDAQFGAQPADVTNVTFTAADGTTVAAYLAQPPDGMGTYPAVMMVHEWWGLNAEIVEMANRLAAQGYVVLAPDTYRGRTAISVPGALYLRISVPAARVDADMQAAFDFLAALPNVDAARIGVMGFCYGGGVALRHAVSNPRIAATINLYGDTIDDPANFGALLTSGRPLLGIFGEADQQIPVAEVRAFERALQAAGVPATVTVYPAMPHAFVNPHGIDAGGAPAEAWRQILDFLARHLQSPA